MVAPKNVLGGWRRQINGHLNLEATLFVAKRDLKRFLETHRSLEGLVFVVLNYEMLRTSWRRLRKCGFHMIVADEGHRAKNRKARQSKALHKLGDSVDYRLELTGTPIGKDEIDLWSQMRFVNSEVLGHNWTDFDERFLRKAGYMGHDRKFKLGMKKKMLRLIEDHVVRVNADDVLDLPPVTEDMITFELTGKAKKAYREMEQEFLFKFGDFTSTSTLAITQMLRLQQLTGGFIGLDDKSLLRLEQDKLAAFADWMEDFPKNEKLVVFAQFTSEIDMIAELMRKLGRSYAIRDGRTRTRDLDSWISFQEEKHPLTYIAQIASGGVGTDLYAARVGVFYSNTLNYIDYDQARKRIIRNGQRRKVLLLHLVAENTIDEARYLSLGIKHKTADAVLSYLSRNRKQRRL